MLVRIKERYVDPARIDPRKMLYAALDSVQYNIPEVLVEPDVGGVYGLLREASEIVPGVRELKIEELCVGLRPGIPDNTPALGADRGERLVWAAGHHRNGILLAPITAQLLTALLAGERLGEADAELLRACDPRRFASEAAATDEPTAVLA